jgi:hypothetical protein
MCRTSVNTLRRPSNVEYLRPIRFVVRCIMHMLQVNEVSISIIFVN